MSATVIHSERVRGSTSSGTSAQGTPDNRLSSAPALTPVALSVIPRDETYGPQQEGLKAARELLPTRELAYIGSSGGVIASCGRRNTWNASGMVVIAPT